jgi:endoglucanase
MSWGFFLFFLMVFVSGSAEDKFPAPIRLNQVGFYPQSSKLAIVEGAAGMNFQVKEVLSGKVVFEGRLGEVRVNPWSGKQTRTADFSRLNAPGFYQLVMADGGSSHDFKIGEAVHKKLAIGAMKAFYYQRASMELVPNYAGKWARKAGHPDTDVRIHSSAISPGRPENTSISTSGGWYDAGDYNKYIVNSGITMGTLLSLLEDYPEFSKQISTHIPESSNRLPDLLDEILWNLRWMITMQDPTDGGVYHKQTNTSFDPTIMPEQATRLRYVVQKSTAATLDFAAVMAQSARVIQLYESDLPGLADSCRSAALKAWRWAKANPGVYYKQGEMNQKFTPAITTGEYGDQSLGDEWLWAATELFLVTGDKRYLPVINLNQSVPMPIPGWNQVEPLACYSLMRLGESSLEQARLARAKILLLADRLIQDVERQPYETVMGQQAGDFRWGSSSVAANQGVLLLQAYRLTGNRNYLEGALSNLDYLLGRNATGYSFVTGFGSKQVMHPHHRISMADQVVEPVPGLLSGGPNAGKQDKCATYPSNFPEESFTDDDCSYASNEIAINWNAPLVYLVVALGAEFQKLIHE